MDHGPQRDLLEGRKDYRVGAVLGLLTVASIAAEFVFFGFGYGLLTVGAVGVQARWLYRKHGASGRRNGLCVCPEECEDDEECSCDCPAALHEFER